SEESVSRSRSLDSRRILRCAQNDTLNSYKNDTSVGVTGRWRLATVQTPHQATGPSPRPVLRLSRHPLDRAAIPGDQLPVGKNILALAPQEVVPGGIVER